MAKIKAPKAEDNKSEPFSVGEVKALLKAAEGGRQFQARNKAMLLVLLDTGIRASEFCGLSIFSLDLKAGRIEVTEGKGGKKRFVRIGVASRKALWKYLSERAEVDPLEPLFKGQNGKALERTNLRKILKNIGDKAGVSNCYPHRFRYTFAIEYLRNGGDIFTLQELLGHSSLVMVRYYAKVAEVDTAKVHERAGPVDNWLR